MLSSRWGTALTTRPAPTARSTPPIGGLRSVCFTQADEERQIRPEPDLMCTCRGSSAAVDVPVQLYDHDDSQRGLKIQHFV